MKPKIFMLVAVALGLAVMLPAQQTDLPDLEALMKMSPEEREKYAEEMKERLARQALDLADAHNLALDKSLLPGYTPSLPARDEKRLAMLPATTPGRVELLMQISRSGQQLASVMPGSQLQALQSGLVGKNAAQLQESAIAHFYSNHPAEAIYVMMEAVKKQPDSVVVWNNLAAMYSMSGLEHRAVPILQYGLQLQPGSSMMLNNLGQAYLGLGDLLKARKYLEQCIAVDSLNPDANRSMAAIHLAAGELPQARQCLVREMTVCVRKSSRAMLERTGGAPISVRETFHRRGAYNGRDRKNHFEEIELGKFILPPFPKTTSELESGRSALESFAMTVAQEARYWGSISFSQEERRLEGQYSGTIYADWVEAMLDEVHEEFTPEHLNPVTEQDSEMLLEMINKHARAAYGADCPEPPTGSSTEAYQAYKIKCCEEKKRPHADNLLSELAGFIRPKLEMGQNRWKDYINQLIDVARLNPSIGNQLLVYGEVAAYFTYLQIAVSYGLAGEIALPDCVSDYSQEAIYSVIRSNHQWLLDCPKWMNFEADFKVAKLKADCTKYGLEAGAGLLAEYEHSFVTGTSTLAAGVGVKANFFEKIGKGGMKAMAYVSFDNNNEFSDFGVKAKAEVSMGEVPVQVGPVKPGEPLIGVEGGLQLGINSGFTSGVKGKGVLIEFIKVDQSL